jgi:predicted helicase
MVWYLTDTFQLYEQERDMIADLLPDNSKKEQTKKREIKIIIGNPPYSIGQKSENDNAQNLKYLNLDEKFLNNITNKNTICKTKCFI